MNDLNRRVGKPGGNGRRGDLAVRDREIRWETAGGVFDPVITTEQVVRPEDARAFPTARDGRGEAMRRASVSDEGVDAPRRDDLRQAAARPPDRPGSTIAHRAEFMHDRAGGAQNVGEPSGKADGELHFQAGREAARLALGERSELRFHTTVQVAGGDVQQARGCAARFRSAHGRLGTITGRPAGPVKPGSARTCR